MLFNSIDFLIFFPIVFALYWMMQNGRLVYQNLLLLAASYVFYGWWDYRFLLLIIISSTVDYVVGLRMFAESHPTRRKILLIISLCANLGLLGFFKYFNFFIDSFAALLESLGMSPNITSLQIVLPVGISFYTFQTLSYTIDIYRKKMEPTRDAVAFFVFVAFFPQLVAGPIERAKSLLPQFLHRRSFDVEAATDGMRQMLWGFFKKVLVADNAALTVNYVFGNYQELSGIMLGVGVFLFAIQIYCDFSGYSDIAIGVARLFGIRLRRNFAFPYFSRDIAEFWRRWHISLSTWFRDYVYIPLGGSRTSVGRRIFNIIVTFTVSGFWHGANWTFLFWGFLNGLYYIPLMLSNKHKTHTEIAAAGRLLPGGGDIVKILVTFFLVLIAWVFFRAESITQAFDYIIHMFSNSWLSKTTGRSVVVMCYAISLLAWEWVFREKEHALDIREQPLVFRWLCYNGIAVSTLLLGNLGKVEFIYFQF